MTNIAKANDKNKNKDTAKGSSTTTPHPAANNRRKRTSPMSSVKQQPESKRTRPRSYYDASSLSVDVDQFFSFVASTLVADPK
jgi:hypothetical protein